MCLLPIEYKRFKKTPPLISGSSSNPNRIQQMKHREVWKQKSCLIPRVSLGEWKPRPRSQEVCRHGNHSIHTISASTFREAKPCKERGVFLWLVSCKASSCPSCVNATSNFWKIASSRTSVAMRKFKGWTSVIWKGQRAQLFVMPRMKPLKKN